MKKIVLIFLLMVSVKSMAQPDTRIVLHLQSSDTLVHKSIVNQIGNIKKALPGSEIELVCHGPGLDFLLKEKSTYINRLEKMHLQGVSYVGCEYTMSQKKIKREELVDIASTVPYGIVEIIKRQQEGWAYVKLGF